MRRPRAGRAGGQTDRQSSAYIIAPTAFSVFSWGALCAGPVSAGEILLCPPLSAAASL